jgi:hypothetical protein
MIVTAYKAESLPKVVFLPNLMSDQDWCCLGFAAVRRVTMNAGLNTGKTLHLRAAFDLVVRGSLANRQNSRLTAESSMAKLRRATASSTIPRGAIDC